MKVAFTCLACLCVAGSFAQLQKGNQLLTGSLSFNTTNQESFESDRFITEGWDIGVEFGKQRMYKNNRIRGLSIGYQHSYEKFSTLTGSSPFFGESGRHAAFVSYLQQYLIPLGKNWYVTTGFTGQFGYARRSQTAPFSANLITHQFSLQAGVVPGIAYQFHKRWLADFQLGQLAGLSVLHSRSHLESATNIISRPTTVRFNTAFSGDASFRFGFRYILR